MTASELPTRVQEKLFQIVRLLARVAAQEAIQQAKVPEPDPSKPKSSNRKLHKDNSPA
ncbi:hypothetical protein HL658_03500 [Azospirillum sp. RWY-5-1]|uniref:Uncharacterized protein n=1 Tax=Azospirillum oleiclasticum TaxID=2735135 RepID=A0ABX2T3D3_9PROT|nr:hypothetical protein [Azospirillum oleiclasticum]NYZ11602.1 hypothetical protein [Azospirillum oleiclasticum]NYZ18763.1 hypothetical protein [Azospirillum oleiclasticum]